MSTFHLLLPERMQLANFSNHFVTTSAKSPKSGIFLMERREREENHAHCSRSDPTYQNGKTHKGKKKLKRNEKMTNRQLKEIKREPVQYYKSLFLQKCQCIELLTVF